MTAQVCEIRFANSPKQYVFSPFFLSLPPVPPLAFNRNAYAAKSPATHPAPKERTKDIEWDPDGDDTIPQHSTFQIPNTLS